MARRVSVQLRVLAVAVVGASLASGIVAAAPASAQDVKGQIATAERQLRQLNIQADAASERYDGARIKLASAQRSASAAQSRLESARAKVSAMQRSASSFAVAAYEGGPQSAAVSLASGSTSTFINKVSGLQAVSSSQAQALTGVEAARRAEAQAQVDASAALANQRSATATMAAARQQIINAAAKEQKILTSLQAKEAAIIKAAKAAKARAAALAAERAVAALARQKAAAAAAAKALAAQRVSPPAPTPAPATPSSGHVSSAGGAATAVSWAYKEIGKPYVWGAAGPNSFDCSGLALYVWAKAGVYLQHFTGDQWNEGPHVSRADLEPGDLVFFAYNTSDASTIHHVGIYVGGGDMIDAPYTGAFVRKEPAFRSDYIGAVRP
jgi:peptidoglycan DL-endopeptidase CwlO